MATSMMTVSLKVKSESVTMNKQCKKNMMVKEMNQLNIQLKNLEKDKISQLYNRNSHHRNIFVQLEENDQKFAEGRKQEFQRLCDQLNKVKSLVMGFRRELDDIKATPEFVERLKVIMEEIEVQISIIKEQQRLKYDELLYEERTLFTEIDALEKKFDSWTVKNMLESKPNTSQASIKSARDVNKSLPSEVAAFNKFLQQTGGVRGGWDEYDHATFLKLQAKHKNPNIFIQEAIHSLPTRTEEQINEHKMWYKEYLRMQEVKKQAIAEWKEEKNIEKEEKLTQAEKTQDEEKIEDKRIVEERLKQIEAEKQMNRERLQAWKENQKRQKEIEETRKRRITKKKAAEEEAWRRKQEELHQQVGEFRQKKTKEQETKAVVEEAKRLAEEEEKRRLISERAGHIQVRTKQMLQAREAAAEAKLKAAQEKEQRLEKLRSKVRVEVSSDPDRLLKPTEGWKERQKKGNEEGGTGRVFTLPHRAVPTWRQGVH